LCHQTETVEFAIIPGLLPFQDDCLKSGTRQDVNRFRGHYNEKPAPNAQLIIDGTAFDGGAPALDLNVSEDLIRTVAPENFADKSGNHWNVGKALVLHDPITHKAATVSCDFLNQLEWIAP
jgi:hypothetical protein